MAASAPAGDEDAGKHDQAADRLQVLNVPATRTAAPEAAKEEQA